MLSITSLFNALTLVAVVFASLLAMPATVNAEGEPSSRRQSRAAEVVGEIGGRVSKIAANTDDHEVTFALLGDKVKDKHVQGVPAIENVIWLNLASTGITDAAVESIKAMKLQKLHLEKTGVTDASLKSLSEMKTLTYLNLYKTKVTDAGLVHLQGLDNLEQLHLWQTEVTKEAADKLKESLPKLQITGFAEPPAEPQEIETPKPNTDEPKQKDQAKGAAEEVVSKKAGGEKTGAKKEAAEQPADGKP